MHAASEPGLRVPRLRVSGMSRRARVQHPSQDVRGIDIPCVEMKMVERVFSFADKAIHGPALMPQQVGVAVSGGITMLTAGVEGEATLDFLREVEEVAGDQSSADLYHWSAMEFGEHWLQRLTRNTWLAQMVQAGGVEGQIRKLTTTIDAPNNTMTILDLGAGGNFYRSEALFMDEASERHSWAPTPVKVSRRSKLRECVRWAVLNSDGIRVLWLSAPALLAHIAAAPSSAFFL